MKNLSKQLKRVGLFGFALLTLFTTFNTVFFEWLPMAEAARELNEWVDDDGATVNPSDMASNSFG